MQVLVFYDFGLKTRIHAPFWGFWSTFPPKNVTHRRNPKGTVLGRNHVIWAIKHEYRLRGSSWVCEEEKKTVQDRTGKKSQKGYISLIWWEAPTEAIYIKNCVVGDLVDVITCAKFQNEIFRGYYFAGGRIFHFLIDFWMGLTTVQRCCAACERVVSRDHRNINHR